MTQAAGEDTIPLRNPRLFAAGEKAWAFLVSHWRQFASYFTDREPTFFTAFVPLVALSCILYMRYLPTTNYIFDEQEALLGNPYVNQQFKYEDAIYRDFWGLPANASIGSYRPIPNYMWRGLVEVGERGQRAVDYLLQDREELRTWLGERIGDDNKQLPNLTEKMRTSWPQHWFNLLFHGVNGAIFTAMGWRVTRRKSIAWFAGATFVACALLTEAVSGVVGIADVLGGLGALLALASLGLRAHVMPFAVFLSVMLGLFSKESAIVCIPLVPVAALLSAPIVHSAKPARVVRAVLATVGVLAAFVLYVELRKRWFPSPLPSDLSEIPELGTPISQHATRDFMIWFHQAPLPKDPLNNPLVDAQADLRVAGAMRVYFRGLLQVFFPWHLSGDYSSPQEPVPASVVFPESVLGWGATVLPLGAALGMWVVSLRREFVKPEVLPEELAKVATVRQLAWACPAPALVIWLFDLKWALLAAVVIQALWTGSWYWKEKKIEVGSTPEQRYVALRFVVEFSIVSFATWVAASMLGIGPGAINQTITNTTPHDITMPAHILQDVMVYAAFASLAFGAFTEALWIPRRQGRLDFVPIVAAVGMVWLVVSYFPHSNMYVLLPTVRAERLWYFPVIGTTMFIAVGLWLILDRLRRSANWSRRAWMVPAAFLAFQAGRAYWHATDYRDDLTFWKATKDAVPNSSKAHLNYSVMAGARGLMEVRLQESHIARTLAPDWAMAHIYTGDTLCRMGRPDEAWPHYARGFELGPNDKSLISLALQCLWDYKKLTEHEAKLRELSAANPGSWLAHLVNDTLLNGDKQGGVQREHKPRSYNQSAKEGEGEGEGESTGEKTETAEGE